MTDAILYLIFVAAWYFLGYWHGSSSAAREWREGVNEEGPDA